MTNLSSRINKLLGSSIINESYSEAITVYNDEDYRKATLYFLEKLHSYLNKLNFNPEILGSLAYHYVIKLTIEFPIVLDALEDIYGLREQFLDYPDEFYYPNGPRILNDLTFSFKVFSCIFVRDHTPYNRNLVSIKFKKHRI